MKPLFGGFFRIAPLVQTDDDGGFSALRRWRNQMMMVDDVDAQSDDDGGRCGRQPPKDGCIIVAPGRLAYLGLVVERKNKI